MPSAVFAFLFFAADLLTPLPGSSVKVSGEIGRRIDATIYNNLLAVDVEKDFLAPLSTRDPKSGYIGLGKFLMSAVRFASYTSDPKVLALKDRLVTRILAAQEPDGYLGFFSPPHRVIRLWDIHEMGYLIAGLTDNYTFFRHQPSLDAAVRSANYILARWKDLPPDWGKDSSVAPNVAVTGLERTLLQLWRVTRDNRYAQFVTQTRNLPSWDLPILIGRRPGIEGHIYHYMARALAQLELHRSSPSQSLLKPADRAVAFLLDEGMAITGGAGQWEIWTNDQDGRGQLGETCATAYQLRVYDNLLRLRAEPLYGDLIERTVFNALFAAQSPDGRRIRYYAPTEGPREYHPVDTYCCPTNYRRIISELPEMIYYQREDGVVVNLYTASQARLTIESVPVTISQQTEFPTRGGVVVGIEAASPVDFSLHLRIPAWAEGVELSVNGQPAPVSPGTFATISRQWRPGDRVALHLPLAPRLVLGRQRQAGRAAVLRGPVVYALNPLQHPDLQQLDAADLGRFTLDPASLEVVPDSSVRPNGSAVRAGAWKPGYSTAAKHDFSLTLTEFPDPGATATYFKLRDLSAASPDPLHKN